MKKFNKNSLLFLFAVIFIIVGLSLSTIRPILGSCKNVFTGSYSIEEAKNNIIKVADEKLTYHDLLIDVNSLKENLLGTRVIQKDDTLVVKADSESLIEQIKKLNKTEIQKVVDKIDTLKTVSENNGAGFLYCIAPTKELYETAPSNIDNYAKENYSLFLSELAVSNIPTIDFAETINSRKNEYQPFYNTDHHWTVRSGFYAKNTIVTALHTKYGFEYNKELMDLSNYRIEYYKNWFLGSKGYNVGTFFTWRGADDFELITPKFETNLIEEQPFKNKIRTGGFKDTVLYMDKLKKDYYKNNTYCTYSGGDYRLQIIRNNLNPSGKKILIIKDSFANVVTPFLALHLSELHICDMRDNDSYVGKKLNTEEYIKKIKPDYVIVLYSGIAKLEESRDRYNFF